MTEVIVWRTHLVRVCRLMSDEQTEVVSDSYTMYYSVRSSLRKTGKDLCIHLVQAEEKNLSLPSSNSFNIFLMVRQCILSILIYPTEHSQRQRISDFYCEPT